VRTHQRVEITRNGRRDAILMSADDFDSLQETLDILADPEAMRDMEEGLRDIREGRVYTLEQVTEEMRASGRLPR
jgi:antitoxin YefM